MWTALSARDWSTLKACLHPDVHYADIPTPDSGARGPDNVVKRLEIAFDQIVEHEHVIHHLVVDGDVALLDHTETWTFKTGEKATNPFATVHELKDGRIILWSDYWDVNNFVSQFPAWFIEHMAKHTAAHFDGEDA
jgi:ketosteroid isomerase-like protein